MSLPASTKPFLSVQEAADRIGCTVGRVRQLLLEGIIAGMKLNERAWAVDSRSCERFAKAPKTTGRPRQGAKKSA